MHVLKDQFVCCAHTSDGNRFVSLSTFRIWHFSRHSARGHTLVHTSPSASRARPRQIRAIISLLHRTRARSEISGWLVCAARATFVSMLLLHTHICVFCICARCIHTNSRRETCVQLRSPAFAYSCAHARQMTNEMRTRANDAVRCV